MRTIKIRSIFILLVLLLTISGCSVPTGTGTSKNTDTTSNEMTNISSNKNSAYLTSSEAASLAYIEALKWNKDPVLWDMQAFDIRLHYDWVNNDKSSGWQVAFANPVSEDKFYVTIYNKEVTSVNDMNTRNTEVLSTYKKDAPGISMSDAAKAAIANGAPSELMPFSIEYDIDGTIKSLSGPYSPMWTIGYRFDITETTHDLHFYHIDGSTGEFLEMTVKTETGDVTDASTARVKPADYNKYISQIDNRDLVLKYFTLIEEGKYDDAIAMMDKRLVPDSASEDMWKNGWEIFDEIRIYWTYKEDEDNWTEDTQRFEVNLVVKLVAGSQDPNWSDGDNVRFMTFKKVNDKWFIYELATSP